VKVFAGVAGAMAVISLAASSKSRRASAGFLPSSRRRDFCRARRARPRRVRGISRVEATC